MESGEKNISEQKLSWDKVIVSYLQEIIYFLVIMVVIILFLFRLYIVSGTSMNMTLLDGDYLLLLSNALYQTPEQGDIVVISKDSFENGVPIIKRIVATEGQTVDIDFSSGTVYVDGAALEESYINNLTTSNGGMMFPLVVEEGCVFVMGDNRNVSRDSRFPEIGLIDEREIIGKAIFLIIPGTNKGQEIRDYSRIGVID